MLPPWRTTEQESYCVCLIRRQHLNARGGRKWKTKDRLKNGVDKCDFLNMAQTCGKLEDWYGLKVTEGGTGGGCSVLQ